MLIRRWTNAVVAHPWVTLAVTFILTALFVWSIPRLQSETDFKKLLSASDPAVQAMKQAEKYFGSQDFFMILVETPDTIFKIDTIAKIHDMEQKLKELQGVDDIQGPTPATVISATEKTLTIESAAEILPKTPQDMEAYRQKVMGDPNLHGAIFSADGKAAGILIKLNPYLDNTNTLVQQVNQIAELYRARGMNIYVGGMAQFRYAILQSMESDMRLLIPLVILVMELVLVFAFRTGRGVGLPFLLMVLSAVWTVGTMGLVGSPITPFSFFMPVMLIVASKAYAIYTVNRYYEESMHAADRSKNDVIVNTMVDMAKPLSMDALAEIAGFLSLLAVYFWAQQTFGLFIAVGIFYTLLINFAVLPAILALLPVSKKRYDYERGWLPDALAGFGRFIARRNGWVLGISAAVMVAFAVAIPQVKVETTPQAFLGANHPALIASNALERDFGGSAQFSIEVDADKPNGLQDPAVLNNMLELQEFLKAQPEYGGTVSSLANLVRTMNQKFHADDPSYYVVPDNPKLAAQLLTLFTFSGGDLGTMASNDFSKGEVVARTKQLSSAQISNLTKRVRQYLAQHFQGPVTAVPVGSEQAFASLAEGTVPNTVLTLMLALVAAFLIVTLLLRSLVAGLVSIAPMMLTIVMNLGTMSYFHLPLDLASLMIGSIAVGVGIDYTINFIIRWREEIARQPNVEQALETSMRTMGRGILLNALTLTLGFAVFYLSKFGGLRDFGLLINLTMIWSFIGAFTLIPALLLRLKPRFLTALSGASASSLSAPAKAVEKA